MTSPLPWSSLIAEYVTTREAGMLLNPATSATPRLATGPHWGIIEGFEDLSTAAFDGEARATELLDTAEDRGASITRIQIDWAELEIAPGVYDQAALDAALAELTARGQAGFVTLATLDSEGLRLPDYMTTGLTGLTPGYSLDSSATQSAFAAFLDWLVPQLTEIGVWGLSLGNEVEIPVEDGLVTETEAASFFEAGLAHAKALDPDMAVSVTLTASAADLAPVLTQRIAEASDIFVVNFYGDQDGQQDPANWQPGLDAIKEMAGDLPVFFQELGMPIGYDAAGLPGTSAINGSLEMQEAFFDFMGHAIAQDDQLLGATVFQLFDWSADLVAEYLSQINATGAPTQFSQFEEVLQTIGLASWADGTTRPAWDTWLGALDSSEAIRAFYAMPVVTGTSGSDDLSGTDAGNRYFAAAGDDTVIAGAGQDAAFLGAGNDVVLLGAGDDLAQGGDGLDEVFAGEGHDWVSGGSDADLVSGENGNDTLSGDDGNDSLLGGDGEDVLNGGTGDDALLGGSENDTLRGDEGEDVLRGEAGADLLFGGSGEDILTGDEDDDLLHGEGGDDFLLGGDGDDRLTGGANNDTLLGEMGDDTLQGDTGNDLLAGEQGRDLLDGHEGNDSLLGGEDEDVLFGGAGFDALYGGRGNDVLNGGTEDDLLVGEDGADIFMFNLGDGQDVIVDFEAGVDILELEAALLPAAASLADSLAQMAFVDDDALILNFTSGDSLTFLEITSIDAVLVGFAAL